MSGKYRRPPNSSLYIRNLSFTTKTDELKSVFANYGKIQDVYIPLDYYSGKPRGFAYVQFEDVRDAEEALHHLDGCKLHGSQLEIQYAEGDRKTPSQMRGRDRGNGYDNNYSNRDKRRFSNDYNSSSRYNIRYGGGRDFTSSRYSTRKDYKYYKRSRSNSPPSQRYRERHRNIRRSFHRDVESYSRSRSREKSYSRSESYSRSRSRSSTHSPLPVKSPHRDKPES